MIITRSIYKLMRCTSMRSNS